MERLTKKHYGGNGYYMACSEHCNKECFDCKEIDKIIDRLGTYEDTGLEPEDLKKAFNETAILELAAQALSTTPDHLRDILQAEQDGRLEVLPCKVGDHILADGREAIVVWFFGYKTGRFLHVQFLDNAECADIPFYEIGKNRLPDPEEAEAALAKEGDPEQ